MCVHLSAYLPVGLSVCDGNLSFSGLVVSTYDVMLYSKTQGYMPTLACYLRNTLPIAAAGATFAAVTCTSTTLRGKDDKLNYFYGGASAGGIFGVTGKSFLI